MRRGCALGACTLVAALAFARDARAQQCGRPDVLDTVPPDLATDVPPNASLTAHYDPSAEYLGEDVVLTPMGGVDEVVTATFDDTQGLLTYVPPAPLTPGAYVITWPSLRGLNAAALGTDAVVHFTVGATDDTAPPVFDGVTAVTWDLERKNNTCTNSIEDRMVFELSLAPASDDGGRDGLRLVIFQTAGSGVDVDAGSVPVQTMAMPAVGKAAEVKLPVSDATGHVCFAAIARDLTGKISNGGSHAVCVDTIAPPFFRGCAVAPEASRGARGVGLFVGLFLVAMVLARARRRRRAR
ncbi:MAG TPA: Ig-like domain-containing protein [Polyangia bacterium]|nr:Ig-like domain-containing protein [Polyangia bacterium]